MEQVEDRGPAVFAAFEPRDIGLRRVVDRFDRALGNGNADQYPRDRFGDRLGNEPIAICPPVLVMFKENLVVPCDQKAGDGIARQIFDQRRLASPEPIANIDSRPFERPWRFGARNPPGRIDFIEMAERANTILWLIGIAGLNRKRTIGNWKAFSGSIELGIRA